MDKTTQYWAVKKRLADRQWHSCFELSLIALRFGARVHELRKAGFHIERRETRRGRERHVSYRMVP